MATPQPRPERGGLQVPSDQPGRHPVLGAPDRRPTPWPAPAGLRRIAGADHRALGRRSRPALPSAVAPFRKPLWLADGLGAKKFARIHDHGLYAGSRALRGPPLRRCGQRIPCWLGTRRLRRAEDRSHTLTTPRGICRDDHPRGSWLAPLTVSRWRRGDTCSERRATVFAPLKRSAVISSGFPDLEARQRQTPSRPAGKAAFGSKKRKRRESKP